MTNASCDTAKKVKHRTTYKTEGRQ